MTTSKNDVEINTDKLPTLIKMLEDYIQKTEDFIHTDKKNPFQLPGKDEKVPTQFAIRNFLVTPVTTSAQPTSDKPKKAEVVNTVKPAVAMLLEDGIMESLKRNQIKEFSLLVTPELTLADMQNLWGKINIKSLFDKKDVPVK